MVAGATGRLSIVPIPKENATIQFHAAVDNNVKERIRTLLRIASLVITSLFFAI